MVIVARPTAAARANVIVTSLRSRRVVPRVEQVAHHLHNESDRLHHGSTDRAVLEIARRVPARDFRRDEGRQINPLANRLVLRCRTGQGAQITRERLEPGELRQGVVGDPGPIRSIRIRQADLELRSNRRQGAA